MPYRLQVTKMVPNEAFAEQMKEWRARDQFSNMRDYGQPPAPTEETNVLSVELTDDEYNAVKRAVIETWA